MWIVRVALARPYTFVAMALLILMLSPIVVLRTPTDIFPDINIPVISVIWTYTGLPAVDMAQRITTLSERGLTTDVSDVEHIESQSLNGISVVKVFFHPTANVQTALAQVISSSQAQLKSLPTGITPPLVIQYSASSVPVLQIGLSSPQLSEQTLNDIGTNVLKTQLATVQGAAVPFPYGGKPRAVMVNLNTAALQAKGLSPSDVVNAVSAENLVLPSGTAKVGPTEFNVELNASPQTVAELNNIPVRTVNGATIYLRDVAQVSDGFTPQTNVVRQDGVRGALLSVIKHGGASTLDIVSRVRQMLPQTAKILPQSLKITPLFDQSLFVRAAVQGVLREAAIAACLTAIMILIFLGSWRSTLIVAISIPLSILTSIIVLSAIGETINIMTLGGLALAVGILVDDATVTLENIDRHLALGKDLESGILDGAAEIAIPAMVSTLSICIVFVPMLLLTGVARYLFVPLAEAVVFAMLASYLLSRTLVPTMVQYLMRGHAPHAHADAPADTPSDTPADTPADAPAIGHAVHAAGRPGIFTRFHAHFETGFERLRNAYRTTLSSCVAHPLLFIAAFLGFTLVSFALVPFLGQEFFPAVDAGAIQLHVRARAGLRIEETAKLVDQIEQVLRQQIPSQELTNILDNIGLPYSGQNLSYSNSGTIGTSDADVLISLNQAQHAPTADYVKRLREVLPARFPGVELFFQPADITSQILNFGLPAPIDLQVVGPNQQANYQVAQQMANQMRHIPGAVDVHVHQLLSRPTLHFDVDRTRAQQVGLRTRDVAQNMLVSLAGSFQTTPTFWLNPQNGVSYSVVTQSPQYQVASMQALMNTPVTAPTAPAPQVLSNLVTVGTVMRPAVVSHYNVQPVIDIYAAVQGRDLGGVATDIRKVIADFQSKLPRGSQIVMRGQVQTMTSSFIGLAGGLVLAIGLIYLLIVVNFQSWLDPFIIITALPGALAGIVWMLFITHTFISVPALMGAVMTMGVATANSILVIAFARERSSEGIDAAAAAIDAGYTRLRPVMMTALAMIIGMVPMAIGMGEGGEQNAPLGRAVIGGLLFATIATLFFVPTIFTLIHGRHRTATQTARETEAHNKTQTDDQTVPVTEEHS